MMTEKAFVPDSMATIVKETNFFIKIMQLINAIAQKSVSCLKAM